ncbi:MAG: ferritin [Candidatus Eisenbacteria bacterium]|uniref:Ferritin n=1 Tax=Eiseniibacteriota bacterium TaxID=2212470 RepID=A0A956SGA8_UNCEI|nr:ferritin [Candidatus Eisenbacteria bacterium]MCB9463679.1 ferritin [Candidatus Eisenbacteria bacterium]
MPSQAMLNLFNSQIDMELFSSNQYRQMGAWCESKGLLGCARFLVQQAEEELDHMRKMIDFVHERGEMVVMGALDAPRHQFDDLVQVFRSGLDHEKKVTASIHAMAEQALSEKDFATFNFLQWFVAEQVEEEALFQAILDRMALIGSDDRGLFFIDQEIPTMRPARPAN